MKLVVVDNRKAEKDFLELARLINRDDQNWICPLDTIITSIFDPKENVYFREGEAIRWILKGDNGQLIGRIAAFYNTEKAKKYDPLTGGIGFFECINDQKAAFLLFDAGKSWLENRGMGAMDGPVNFGENDRYWGLLVEGFTPPAFGMNYNPPYYVDLFEAYGFKPFFEQESKHLDVNKPFPERFWKIAEWVIRKPGYTFKHIQKTQFEKFASDIVKIHNAAWMHHEHFAPLTIEKVQTTFEEIKDLLVEEFIWFVYHDDKPIAFLVMLPDVNQVFKLFNGKLNWWNKIRFQFLKNSKKINRSRVTIMGVIPKFQRAGIESALFWQLRDPILKKRPHYKELEISWVGDFNPKMKAILEALGANPGKKHITYRKLFSDKVTFKKAAEVGQ